jgi:hypothetical protein
MIQMQDETPQKDTSPAQPTDGSPDSAAQVPESATPATPAHEEASAASGQPAPVGQAQAESSQGADVSQEAPASEEVAPDADEPGDDVAPEELEQDKRRTVRISRTKLIRRVNHE